MAGLLMKELIARGDLQRCLVVCARSLAEQWQDEVGSVNASTSPARATPANGNVLVASVRVQPAGGMSTPRPVS